MAPQELYQATYTSLSCPSLRNILFSSQSSVFLALGTGM